MSNKKEIIKHYKKKINLLKKHNKLYFSKDNPEITDSEYDKIKREVIELENKNQFLIELKLNREIIGAPPSNKFKKIKHLKPMLSLSNAFDKKDMHDFIANRGGKLNKGWRRKLMLKDLEDLLN